MFNPKYCKKCGHDRGCMHPREEEPKKPPCHHPFLIRVPGEIGPPADGRWVSLEELEKLPVPVAQRRILEAAMAAMVLDGGSVEPAPWPEGRRKASRHSGAGSPP